jgi:hypothetical protein
MALKNMAIWHLFWENMAFIFSKHGKISNFLKESEANVLHFSLERQIKIEFSAFKIIFRCWIWIF